jgi:hypothetical protein
VPKARLDEDVVFNSIVKRKPQYSQEAGQQRNTWYFAVEASRDPQHTLAASGQL